MDVTLLVDHQNATPTTTPGKIVRALLTVTGTPPTNAARSPLALALSIDRSGSMSGDRLESARIASAHAVERLHVDDVVSVVAFADTVDVIAPAAPRREQHALVQQLLMLDTAGSTNLSGGWLAARRQMESAVALAHSGPGSSRRVVLLTDGHANIGITDPATLIDLARTARIAGITTTTIGIGEGYDDDLLRSMADAGGGNSWYIERPDQSKDVLAEELGNLLSVAAQGLTVTITAGDAVELFVVHSTWPVTHTASGGPSFDMGDLYASEPKPLLVEFFVPTAKLDALIASDAPIAVLTVSADVITEGGVEHRVLQMPIASTMEGQGSVTPEVEHAVLLARTAKAREEAARLQRAGDAEAAANAMQQAAQTIAESPLAVNDAYSAELAEQVQDLHRLSARYHTHRFSELEAKYQMQRSYNVGRGKKQYDQVLSRRDDVE